MSVDRALCATIDRSNPVGCLDLGAPGHGPFAQSLRECTRLGRGDFRRQIPPTHGLGGASLLKELNFKQIECFTIGSDGVIDKAAATSAALKVSLLVGSLRNDPRFGFRWRGPPPKLLLKIVSVGFALTALVPSALSAVDPYAAREVGSG